MEKNLSHYVKVYHDHISKEAREDIVDYLNNMNEEDWIQHTYYDPNTKVSSAEAGDKELDVTTFIPPVMHNYVMERVWHGYNQYLTDLNFRWYGSWQAYSSIRYNRYKETRIMKAHCDHIHTLFDGDRKGVPTMTALGLLNDEFEGGEFVLFEEGPVEFKAGDLMIFPSNFLFPHRVDPVTSGTRYSFVAWAW